MDSRKSGWVVCRSCGRRNAAGATHCSLCRESLSAPVDQVDPGEASLRATVSGRGPTPSQPPQPYSPPRPAAPPPSASPATNASTIKLEHGPIWGIPRPMFHLLAGIPVALIFCIGPLPRLAGWVFGAIAHEIGHAVVGWYLGCFSVPFLYVTITFEQSTMGAMFICALLVFGAYHFRADSRGLAFFATLAVLQPILAFTSLMHPAILVAGHFGELVFAAIVFWRAMVGGLVLHEQERAIYAGFGWWWLGKNVHLFGSLIWNQTTKYWYANVTFGGPGQNDLSRLARHFDTSLETVAAFMLVMSILPLPIAIGMYRLIRREEKEQIEREGFAIG